jgi:hypothetical protein
MSRLRPEEQLILLSAGTKERREAGREQAERLGATLDWERLVKLLGVRRLLPTLGPRIIALTGAGVSEGFAVAVQQAADTGRRRGAFLQLIAARVMAVLTEAELRCSALKGPQLSEALYGDPGRRPSSDIDLLVAPEHLREAVEVVRGLGYAAPTDHVEASGLPLLHFALIHERGELPPIELHWRIHWYERDFARDRLLAPLGDRAGAWRPAPLDELTALLLFYARDGFLDLRLATDLGACWDAFGASLQPGALDESIAMYPALERVLLAATSVAERTVGLPMGGLTERAAKLSRRGSIAARLANPNPYASESQLYAEMGLVDGLLAPPGGFIAFIRRQVAPPREVIREHARKVPGARAQSSLGHGLRVLGRYALALARLPARRPYD